MTIFRAFATVALGVSFGAYAAITLDDKGIPEGTWSKTCGNATYDKNTKKLTADCKTSYEHFKKAADTNKYTTSSLVLDIPDDIKDIQNHNGWLVAVLHEGGNYVLPEGDYKKECKNCEILLTNDGAGNKVYCVRCTCKAKDSKGNTVEETRMVCHPDLLILQNPLQVDDGVIALNPKYLPQGNYLKTCTQCRFDLDFKRADAKAENGLQLACVCPSTTDKIYNTYVRVPDVKEFLDSKKTFSNTAGILTQD